MIEDPRLQPLPENLNQIELMEHFIKELAYGFACGDWPINFVLDTHHDPEELPSWIADVRAAWEYTEKFTKFYETRWSAVCLPPIRLFTAFGYLEDTYGGDSFTFALTEKAFNLLEKPITVPSVFISYRRRESSAFALLVEARIKEQGGNAYLDKYLKGGDEWHNQLEERVKNSKYLVVLIGPSTLDSPYVQKEIKWALDAGGIVIPVCHNGARVETVSDIFKQVIGREMPNADDIKNDVDKASAAEYETLVNFVLNSLGYGTY